MKSVTEMKRSAPTSSFVSLAKFLTPVVDYRVFRDCIAPTAYGAYQNIIEVVELQCKVGGTREVQKYTHDKDGPIETAPVV